MFESYITKFEKPGEKEQTELGRLFHLKRRTSFYLSIPFVYLPFTPNGITILSNLLQLAGLALILYLPGIERLYGLLIYYFADILDFVDGNIARYRSQCSTLGVFLDQTGHVLLGTCFVLTPALAAFIDSGDNNFLYLAIVLTTGSLFMSYQLVAIHQFIQISKSSSTKKTVSTESKMRTKVRKLISGIYHFKSELLGISILLNSIPVFVWAFSVYFPIRVSLQFLLDRLAIASKSVDEQ